MFEREVAEQQRVIDEFRQLVDRGGSQPAAQTSSDAERDPDSANSGSRGAGMSWWGGFQCCSVRGLPLPTAVLTCVELRVPNARPLLLG